MKKSNLEGHIGADPNFTLTLMPGSNAVNILMHKVLGGNVVVVNSAGCMTLMATYPFTPLSSSWLYTTMGGASAGAQGVHHEGVICVRAVG